MNLAFNAPVPRQLAEAIRLNRETDTLKPSFDSEGDAQHAVNSMSFEPLFAQSSAYTLSLPANFEDASGRTLRNADSFPLKVAMGACRRWPNLPRCPLALSKDLPNPTPRAMTLPCCP